MRCHQALENQILECEAGTMKLMNGLHVHLASNGLQADSLQARLQDVREATESGVYQVHTERHASETRLEQLSDTYAAEVRGHLAEDSHLHQEAGLYVKDVQAEICHLHMGVNQAADFRVERGRKVSEVVRGKLDEVRMALAAERRIRDSSERTLLGLFGQMGQRVSQEFEANREERVATGKRLTALLETASKLLSNTQGAAEAAGGAMRLDAGCDARTLQSCAIQDNAAKRRTSSRMSRSSRASRCSPGQ